MFPLGAELVPVSEGPTGEAESTQVWRHHEDLYESKTSLK